MVLVGRRSASAPSFLDWWAVPSKPDVVTTATPLIFVYAFHNLPGISDGEWVNYYKPEDEARLRADIRHYVQIQLDLFRMSAEYGEYFATAEYESPCESFDDQDLLLFRAALPRTEQNTPLEELHPSYVFGGLRAVVLHQLEIADLDQTHATR